MDRQQTLLTEALQAIKHLNFGAPGDANAPQISSPVFRAMVEAGFVDADGTSLIGQSVGAATVRVPIAEVPMTRDGLLTLNQRAEYGLRLNTASDQPEIQLPDSDDWLPCAGTARHVWLDLLSELATANGKPWRMPCQLEQRLIVSAASLTPKLGTGSDVYEATIDWLQRVGHGFDIRSAPECVEMMHDSKVSIMQRFESSFRLPPDVRADVLRALRRMCGRKRSVREEDGSIRKFWRVPERPQATTGDHNTTTNGRNQAKV